MTDTFNPLVVFTDADRFESFRKSRTESPVSRAPFMPIWSVLTYDDCLNVLCDTEHFSSDPQYALSRGAASKSGGRPPGFGMIFDSLPPFIREMIVTRDPPSHTRLRGIVMKAFTPRMIARVEPNIAKRPKRSVLSNRRWGAGECREHDHSASVVAKTVSLLNPNS